MIKLAVVDIKNDGVSKYRFIDPHITLQKLFKEDFKVDVIDETTISESNKIEDYDAVFYQISSLMNDQTYEIFKKFKKEGIKIILDCDDYWKLPMGHAMYYRIRKGVSILEERMSIADLITTTTKHLAKKIFKLNKNVVVLPNAINPKERQFTPNPTESERVRVGWVGGSSHTDDLKFLRGIHSKMQNYNIKTQMVVCGFDNHMRNPSTGEIYEVEVPEVWVGYEEILTNNYHLEDLEYVKFLKKYKKEEYPNIKDKSYRRIWTKPINNYGNVYNELDIVLAPLVDNEFNKYKSQLKIIEGGFHKKAMIVSDIEPYKIDCVHGVNSFMVSGKMKKSKKEFFKYTKLLAENESLRNEMGQALHEIVSKRYDINNVTQKRAQIYKNFIK